MRKRSELVGAWEQGEADSEIVKERALYLPPRQFPANPGQAILPSRNNTFQPGYSCSSFSSFPPSIYSHTLHSHLVRSYYS